LVAQSLKVYSDSDGAELRHLRTVRGDHEIDFIIEKGDAILALEAKFSTRISDVDVKQLNWFETQLAEKKVIKAIIYTGQHLVKRDSDNVILVPAACLGA
jgi:predicted AAA+ superfamily ATPase